MATQDRNPDGPAVEKRSKISKTQQQTLLIALVTAVVVGVCGTLAVFFGKYIGFNKKVIVAKDSAISDYETTIKNVGLCIDKNRDGKFSLDEIEKCNPDDMNSTELTGTLRNNVLVNMAKNTDLESVARNNQRDCYDTEGKMIDWQEKFDEAEDDEERSKDFAMLKMCSALRVVPDALPAQENEEALMSSLNQVFILSNWEPESISPSGGASEGEDGGISIIPISLTVETIPDKTMTVLENIEKSIRTFNLKSANIAWSSGDSLEDSAGSNSLTIKAEGIAYYTDGGGVIEETETVYASDAAKKKAQVAEEGEE